MVPHGALHRVIIVAYVTETELANAGLLSAQTVGQLTTAQMVDIYLMARRQVPESVREATVDLAVQMLVHKAEE